MTPNDLRTWQKSQGYTQKSAAEALGLSRSMVAKYLAGYPIPRTVGLACAALAAGIAPYECVDAPASESARLE